MLQVGNINEYDEAYIQHLDKIYKVDYYHGLSDISTKNWIDKSKPIITILDSDKFDIEISRIGKPGCIIKGEKKTTTNYNDISCDNIEFIEIDNPASDVEEISKNYLDSPLTPDEFVKLVSAGNNEFNAVINSQDIYNNMNKFANDMSQRVSDDLQQYISVVRNSHKTFIDPLSFQAPALMLRQDNRI